MNEKKIGFYRMSKNSWVTRLLIWFDEHKRVMPWRADSKKNVESWQTWVSEVMLQQTTVATVTPRYQEFMEKWPTFNALSQASEDEILHFWQGLGYYSRARNLYRGVQYVAKNYNGHLPHDYKSLKKIPGIGDYTAGAIASIAFGEPVPAIDGNVARLLARFWVIGEIGEKFKKELGDKLSLYIPKRTGDFTQALIELGALICRPNNPQCHRCPISAQCQAYQLNKIDDYPKKQKKKEREKREARFYIIQNTQEETLFFKRPAKGLLASLYILPSNNWYNDEMVDIENKLNDIISKRQWLGQYKHIFTHIELSAYVYKITLDTIPRWNDAYWISKKGINDIALPTVIKKALKL